jgi:hypothetical protein
MIILDDQDMLNVLTIIMNESLPYTYRLMFGALLSDLIQPMVTNRMLAYTSDINIRLNDPSHPASEQVIRS